MRSITNCSVTRLCLLIFFACMTADVNAQIIVEEEPRMLYYEETKPRIKNPLQWKDMRDVFHLNKYLMGRKRIMGHISYNTGRVIIDDGKELHDEYRSALGFFFRVRFFEEFCVNATLYKDFNPRAVQHWISDYTYSVGRYNWRPGKFNYGYENYQPNKYTDGLKTFGERFLEGYYFLSYNHYPRALNAWIRMDSTTSLRLIYFTRYSIMYRDREEQLHGGIFGGKSTLGAAMRFTLFWNIYAEGAVYYYPEETLKKQPWDPDFSYGFGYFDWRAFRISLTYGNWAVNRFPWNSKFYPRYGFVDGNFKIEARWMW
jgi:hypothetical protein